MVISSLIVDIENVGKLKFERLIENVHMQGFRQSLTLLNRPRCIALQAFNRARIRVTQPFVPVV
jgi:hypothetical protein